MPRNIIQFQKGLSLVTFLQQYGQEEQCREALFQLRWPNGFVCPQCGNHTSFALKSRKVHQCHCCHHQTSLTARTIFHGSKLPLSEWFLAIHLLIQRKKSISALQLKRDPGVQYNTALKLKQKVMQVMFEQQQSKILSGVVRTKSTFKWVNTVLGNIKTAIRGTFHWVSEKHAPNYLEYRFNRRFDLPTMIDRLVYACARIPPKPCRYLKMAEAYA